MVIERFKSADLTRIGERFRSEGRMLPEGVTYHASWMDPAGVRCFQIMEAAHQGLLAAWVSRWDDLVEFEIIPVMTSAEFWSKAQSEAI